MDATMFAAKDSDLQQMIDLDALDRAAARIGAVDFGGRRAVLGRVLGALFA